MPTLIERQSALVAQVTPIYRERLERGWMGQDLSGQRSRLNRLHIEAMLRDGYSRREAAESAQQCNDVASLNAACDHAEVSS